MPQEQEWAGPEALCPGWLEDEAPDGDVPEDSGDPDGATQAYELLQSTLRQEGLPHTLDRSAEPRTGGDTGAAGTRVALGAWCQAGDVEVAGTRVALGAVSGGAAGVAWTGVAIESPCQVGTWKWQGQRWH